MAAVLRENTFCFYLLADMNGKYLKYYQLLITTLRPFDELSGTKLGFSNELRQLEKSEHLTASLMVTLILRGG